MADQSKTATMPAEHAARPRGRARAAAAATETPGDALKDELRAARAWARSLDPERMEGVAVEIRMLRHVVRDAFVKEHDDTVRQSAETLRRLLRERAIVPELGDGEGAGLEDGLSADLRRVLQRVGMEMGVDV